MFPYCQAFDCSNLRRASVSLALNSLIYFMLAPVNSLAMSKCSELWGVELSGVGGFTGGR